MAKVKYYYNPETLSYQKLEKTTKDRVRSVLLFLSASGLFAILMLFAIFTFFDSPKEKQLKRELEQMTFQFELLNDRMDQVQVVMDDIQERDDHIYRVIFETDPIPASIRKSGFGGVNRYKKLEGYQNSKLIVETTKKIDQLSKQVVIQSKSFDDVIEQAKRKEDMLASIPAIQPVANKDLKRMASGYGYRIDPIYKTRKFHAGMDFSAPTGTPIYSTGDGKVTRADSRSSGYGRHVRIDHGYGYLTLYGHMSKILVRPGQTIKRGEIIGYVGNTGKSVGPHLHYEVHKNGKAVNPVNFYFNDLSPEEYEIMIELSSQPTQSLD
jgi:murein DD-endopeptidase MepM/ murein hydrolase activator NlpD